MRILNGWFKSSPARDTVSWAAILIVISLSLQSLNPTHQLRLELFADSYWIDYALRNAQALIPELMAREDDLLGLQVLVALTLSFRHARDLKPASILLGMAVRSGHRMQLQTTQSMKFFSPEDARQRANVFWVIYMLDQVYDTHKRLINR